MALPIILVLDRTPGCWLALSETSVSLFLVGVALDINFVLVVRLRIAQLTDGIQAGYKKINSGQVG